MVKSLCAVAGADIFDLGTYVTPREIVENILETESRAVVISTYNGIALSFARDLMQRLKESGMEDTLIIMGGLLNENMDGSQLAVDVTEDLRALGINADNVMEQIVPVIAKAYRVFEGEEAL